MTSTHKAELGHQVSPQAMTEMVKWTCFSYCKELSNILNPLSSALPGEQHLEKQASKLVRTIKQTICINSYSKEKSKQLCGQQQKDKWGRDAEAKHLRWIKLSHIRNFTTTGCKHSSKTYQ